MTKEEILNGVESIDNKGLTPNGFYQSTITDLLKLKDDLELVGCKVKVNLYENKSSSSNDEWRFVREVENPDSTFFMFFEENVKRIIQCKGDDRKELAYNFVLRENFTLFKTFDGIKKAAQIMSNIEENLLDYFDEDSNVAAVIVNQFSGEVAETIIGNDNELYNNGSVYVLALYVEDPEDEKKTMKEIISKGLEEVSDDLNKIHNKLKEMNNFLLEKRFFLSSTVLYTLIEKCHDLERETAYIKTSFYESEE